MGFGASASTTAPKYLSESDMGFAKPDGPLARGFKKAGQSMTMTTQLAGGDTEGAAQTVKEAADYAQANPGRPEGQKLMEAWDRGDGVMGGIGNVARQVKNDYDQAKGFIPGLKAVGRDLRAMGEGVVEQVPNMIAPTVGMVGGAAAGSAVGGPVGTVAGGWAGASAGNALVEGGDQIQTGVQKAGIDPRDTKAVQAYLDANRDQLLRQTAIKGGVIGAVDTATAGLAHYLLTAPGKAAAGRALSELGVNVADKAAVKAATQSDAFARLIANDATYQASKKGAGNIARNVTAAGLEPAGEFAGEYAGQGLATGDWDTKNAAMEALSSIGQSGGMFAGQKALQYATRPKQAGEQAPAAGGEAGASVDQPASGPIDYAPPTAEEMASLHKAQMGIDPANGPLSAAASIAVDTGAAAIPGFSPEQIQSMQAGEVRDAAQQAIAEGRYEADRRRSEQEARAAAEPGMPFERIAPEDYDTLNPIKAGQGELVEDPQLRLSAPAQQDALPQGSRAPALGYTPQAPEPMRATADGQVGTAQQMEARRQASAPAERWGSMTATERAALGAKAGIAPVIARNIPRAEWGSLNASVRAKLANVMDATPAASAVDVAAHAAATSPRNDLAPPTEAQAKAGNYKKGHVSIGGLDVAIENPEGSTRSGTDPDGKPWSVTMGAHYGYVKRTTGADGDQVDVYIGKADPVQSPVFVVDQYDRQTGKFDEHKAILGASSLEEAQSLYDAHFSDGKGAERRGAVTPMSFDAFKDWARNGNTKAPMADRAAAPNIAAQAPSTEQAAPNITQEAQRGATGPDSAGVAAGHPPQGSVDAGSVDAGSVVDHRLGGRGRAGRQEAGNDAAGAAAGVPGAGVGGAGRVKRRGGVVVTDERLPHHAEALAAMAQDAGWQEQGGRMIRDGNGNVTGRTKWLPRAEWFQAGMQADPQALAESVRKAQAGEAIPSKDQRTISAMMDYLDAQEQGRPLDEDSSAAEWERVGYNEVSAQEQAAFDAIDELLDATPLNEADAMRALGFTEDEIRAENEAANRQGSAGETQSGAAQERAADDRAGTRDQGAADLLQSYSKQDLADRAEAERQAAERRAQDDKRAEDKARADSERDTFTLTGSDRAADVLASQGQNGLFDQPPPAATPAPAEAKPTNLKDGLARIREEKAAQAAGKVVSPDEFPTKEADTSYSHVSHMGSTRAAADRDAFVSTIQGIYNVNLPAARTDAQKAALLDAVDKAKREYLEENKRLMQVRSGTYSGFVAGGAKLNAKQANRGNAALDRALERFAAMRDGLAHDVARAVRNARTPDEIEAEAAATSKEKADKAAAQQAKNDAFLSKLIDFKPGDDLVIGQTKVVRVNMDREGLPASISFNDGYDPVKLVGPRAAYKTKDDLRAAVARINDAKAAEKPAEKTAPSPLESLFSDLDSTSTRKANKAKKAAAKLPEADRIQHVQANFHDLLIAAMDAGNLEVNGVRSLTEETQQCL